MSLVLTEAQAARAVRTVMPSIMAAIESKLVKRRHLHIVISDPDVMVEPQYFALAQWTSKGGILYQESVGDPDEFEHPYIAIAQSKTHLSWLHRMPTRRLQSEMPHLLTVGDTMYFGSAYRQDLAVGVSGVQAHFDEMFAEWILAACLGLCHDQIAQQLVPNDENFYTA